MMNEIDPRKMKFINRRKFWVDDIHSKEGLGAREADYMYASLIQYGGHKDEFGYYFMYDIVERSMFGSRDLAIALIQPRNLYDNWTGLFGIGEVGEDGQEYMYDGDGNMLDRYIIVFFVKRKVFGLDELDCRDWAFWSGDLDSIKDTIADYLNGCGVSAKRIAPFPYPC